MTTASSNILVSSAGRRGELIRLLKASLERVGLSGSVFAIDRSAYTSAGWLSDGLDLVPPVDEPSFVKRVLEVCEVRSIRHIIPTIDHELPVYAANNDLFAEHGVNVWVSSSDAISIARDKRHTNRWLRKMGFPTVRQVDLANDVSHEFPVIAKPAAGSSSIGVVRVDSVDALGQLDRSLDYVIEEIAPGVEFTVDVMIDDCGVARCAVPRRRIETRAGEVSKGVTVADDDLAALAMQVAEALPGAAGVINVQIFKDDATGEMNVIEINARFGGGFPLSWAAGADMPGWLFAQDAGLDSRPSMDWQSGLVMLRYDAAVFLNESQLLQ